MPDNVGVEVFVVAVHAPPSHRYSYDAIPLRSAGANHENVNCVSVVTLSADPVSSAKARSTGAAGGVVSMTKLNEYTSSGSSPHVPSPS